MRLLLDTNVFLRLALPSARETDPELSTAIDEAEQVLFSTASAWEIAIKHGKGGLHIALSPAELIQAGFQALRLTPLDISVRHALAAGSLPRLHRDPFDRLLVAQALIERLTLVTADRALAGYGAPIFDAARGRKR